MDKSDKIKENSGNFFEDDPNLVKGKKIKAIQC